MATSRTPVDQCRERVAMAPLWMTPVAEHLAAQRGKSSQKIGPGWQVAISVGRADCIAIAISAYLERIAPVALAVDGHEADLRSCPCHERLITALAHVRNDAFAGFRSGLALGLILRPIHGSSIEGVSSGRIVSCSEASGFRQT